eukprot:XP_017951928.1 PREDICTED: vomeronasal type-2 receptor 26-like [Xenopus tropicalis]
MTLHPRLHPDEGRVYPPRNGDQGGQNKWDFPYILCSAPFAAIAVSLVFGTLLMGAQHEPNKSSACALDSQGSTGYRQEGDIILGILIELYLFKKTFEISYGTQDTSFNDRIRFPTFYRIMTSESTQNKAVIHLLKTFKWTWVGILTSDDTGRQERNEKLKAQIIDSGAACVDFFIVIKEKHLSLIHGAIKTIKRSTANVIIIDIHIMHFSNIAISLSDNSHRKIIWISLSSLSTAVVNYPLFALNGSLLLMLSQEEIPGLQKFIYSASPSKFPRDPVIASLWNSVFRPLTAKRNTSNINDLLKICGMSPLNFNAYRLTYNIYISVYALGRALHDMFLDKVVISRLGFPEFMPWKLNSYLKKVNIKTRSVDEMFFNEYGEAPGRLDLLNWNIFPNKTIITRKVGEFNSSAFHKENFIIYKENILWAPHFYGIPHSTCSKNCPPGSRKFLIKEMPTCCHNCVRCPEGEISDSGRNMENCVRCPKIQWSNEQRDKCIMKTLDFLSFEDPLGLSLAFMAIFLSILTTAVLIIFIKYKYTTIVRANNRELSYYLLISLILSFLCSLLFIGWPMKGTCLLRQVVFAVTFTFSISSVLGKTLTVVIAFSATRPGSKLRGWVGTRIPKCIVLLCTLVEIFICSLWLIISPPFPEYDTESHTATMILQCNEGSAFAFYTVVGYIALLAFICLFVAYLSRNLPDIFNEAQYITFSMLVFCSVWVSFIPAYLSTKGKYVTSVEIFAILASGSGLLALIFVPKCYIILFKPELKPRLGLIQLKHM